MSIALREGPIADPVSIFSSMREKFPGECFLLESVEGTNRTARYSFIGADPLSVFKSRSRTVEVDGEILDVENPFLELREYFYSFDCGASELAPFSGGIVGYLGYEMVRFLETVNNLDKKIDNLPESYFVLPNHLVCIDHLNNRTFLITHGNLRDLQKSLQGTDHKNKPSIRIGDPSMNIDRDHYERIVEQAKEFILDGDIFQAVLSRRYEFSVEGDPLAMYIALRQINPSPYLFFLDFNDVKLLGSSPEMLVRLEGRRLVTRPLAGTRRRDKDKEEDEKLKIEMLLDEKERAEHLMLVDLSRNDLGRVSKFGTVKVTELMAVEKYSHVQHIVSNVEGELRDDCDAFDALRSCFPAGTVSGAPKIRAMEIISELEKDPRGPYAGAVGYFDFTGNMDFAITIRSITVAAGKARIQAGAGIVADSVPMNEFNETEHKMRAMLEAIKSISKEGSC
ncbi:MAG: anthranilate synthase component I [Methanomassiliicoccales archaeon]|nr:anthranilate synthase component I [Methanomassiliicoccales archaeon]